MKNLFAAAFLVFVVCFAGLAVAQEESAESTALTGEVAATEEVEMSGEFAESPTTTVDAGTTEGGTPEEVTGETPVSTAEAETTEEMTVEEGVVEEQVEGTPQPLSY